MRIDSSINTAMQSMNRAAETMQQSVLAMGNLGTPASTVDSPAELGEEVTNMSQAEVQMLAAAEVVGKTNELAGQLVDILI